MNEDISNFYKLEKLDSGGYMAYCPAMKPVSVFGKTEKEAMKKLTVAARLYSYRHPEVSNERIVDYLESIS